MKHVVLYSGGAASWETARRVVERYGPEDLLLPFSDTLTEDPDLYRFLLEATAELVAPRGMVRLGELIEQAREVPEIHELPRDEDGRLDYGPRREVLEPLAEAAEEVFEPLVWLQDGRSVWEVFDDERMVGNSRVDPCSKHLKRKIFERWARDRFDEEDDVTLYVGIGAFEADRCTSISARYEQFETCYPLIDWKPILSKEAILDRLRNRGVELPKLYRMGFSHNNCSGFCVKGGHAHFRHLLERRPKVFEAMKREEEARREDLGDIAILNDRTREGILEHLGIEESDVEERVVDGEVVEVGPDGEPLPGRVPYPLAEFEEDYREGRLDQQTLFGDPEGCDACFFDFATGDDDR